MTPTIKNALINALGTAFYVLLVVSMMSNAEKFFPPGSSENILIPMMMLLLFVFSAGVTGSLVFGRPTMWYLDGKKKEALLLLGYTFGFLFVIIAILFLAAYSMA